MKVEVIEKQDLNQVTFPCLMKSRDYEAIVLFFENKKGIVIVKGNYKLYDVGGYNDNWDMDAFKLFQGQVILENE